MKTFMVSALVVVASYSSIAQVLSPGPTASSLEKQVAGLENEVKTLRNNIFELWGELPPVGIALDCDSGQYTELLSARVLD